MFYDLNIPYPVQHSQNLEMSYARAPVYLKVTIESIHLYITIRDISLNIPFCVLAYEKIKQYTRLTILIDDPGQNYGLTSSNSTISSYDLVAVQPTNKKLFQMAKALSMWILYHLKWEADYHSTTVGLAIDRGIYFEISYAPAIRRIMYSGSRRQLISNAQNLVRITRGRNIIITSDAQRAMEHRGPYDIINLGTIIKPKLKIVFRQTAELYYYTQNRMNCGKRAIVQERARKGGRRRE
ncbi:9878_t:CDS:2 [Paraglomus occultum]|uniref:9878_t:CDS:1 n=1 Tax=Paraglomus occultum TaxID=144539 RepID=A0A9N8Z651_9GLOM|nr:9878_t:CDS:2 [Paraglomus occultum]